MADNIEGLIEKYKTKFKLSNITIVKNLSINIVLYAYSEIYGDVVIKIGAPSNTTTSEINFIINSKSKYIVKCYYYNLEDRVMILEKIKPGEQLNIVDKRENQ